MSLLDEAEAVKNPNAPAPPAARRFSDTAWIWQVTALSAVLGVMLSLAITTTDQSRNANVPGNRLSLSASYEAIFREQNARLEDEIKDLRAQVDGYVATIDDSSRVTEKMKAEFEALRREGGLSQVEGPGLRIRLRDKPEGGGVGDYQVNLIHDQDLNNILNELKAAGARNIAVTGADTDRLQRVIVTTTARCVGNIAMVNHTPLAGPFEILVLGDPRELRAALERPEGYIRERELDTRQMVELEEAPRLVLPEYAGTLTTQYAEPVEPSAQDASAESGETAAAS
ncbi:MAG: DUF881 domain-containing protein [Armatimonadota bacterium]